MKNKDKSWLPGNDVTPSSFAIPCLSLHLVFIIMIAAAFVFNEGCAKKKVIPSSSQPVVIPARVITTKTKDEAEKLHQRLSQGANFAQLARQYSIHPTAKKYGYLGQVVVWELDPPYRQAISRLKPGQFSPVFETPEGFAILYYIDNQHLDRGVQLFEAERYQQAADALALDIAQNPDHLKAYSYLGLAYNQLGQTANAIQTFEALIALAPEYPAAQNNLGSAYSKNKQYDKAIKAYSEALVQTPDDPVIMNNLAWVLAKKRRSLDIALKLAERAIILRPAEPEYWDTIAEIHLARGEKMEALKKINKAVELAGPSAYFAKRRKQIASSIVRDDARQTVASKVKPSTDRNAEKRKPAGTPAVKKEQHFYVVQIIATKKSSTATKCKNLFDQRGYRTFVHSRNIPGKGFFHRVRIGPFRSFSEAKATAKEIKEKYRQEYIIMEYTK